MYRNENFRTTLEEVRDENFEPIKQEVSAMEQAIEQFLTKILECSSSVLERDCQFIGM
ncbi:MAG: hypothetical protein R3Y28_05335 [Candidatus Gastranaerophilales bacterium]